MEPFGRRSVVCMCAWAARGLGGVGAKVQLVSGCLCRRRVVLSVWCAVEVVMVCGRSSRVDGSGRRKAKSFFWVVCGLGVEGIHAELKSGAVWQKKCGLHVCMGSVRSRGCGRKGAGCEWRLVLKKGCFVCAVCGLSGDGVWVQLKGG